MAKLSTLVVVLAETTIFEAFFFKLVVFGGFVEGGFIVKLERTEGGEEWWVVGLFIYGWWLTNGQRTQNRR